MATTKQTALQKKLATIEKQKANIEKEEDKIRKQIEADKNKNKPKSIMDLVKSYEDACKYKKVKPVHVYTGNKSGDTVDEIAYKRMKFTFAVLNKGHKFKMDCSEKRHYPYFWLSASGFDFGGTDCDDSDTGTTSASRLCLKNDELARHTGTCPSIFEDYKKFIL